MWGIEFQTPAEEIYTLFCHIYRTSFQGVSNSNGGNLHKVRNSIFSGYGYLKFIFLPLKFR